MGEIDITIDKLPVRLEYNSESQTLTGIATADYLGNYEVNIKVSDNYETVYKIF